MNLLKNLKFIGLIVSRTIFLIPIEKNVFLTKISLGIIYSAQKNRKSVIFFQPIIYCKNYERSFENLNTSNIISKHNLTPIIKSEKIQNFSIFYDELKYLEILDNIIDKYYQLKELYDLVIIEGIDLNYDCEIINKLNTDIIKSTNAEIIFVGNISVKLEYNFINKIKFIFNKIVNYTYSNITASLILNELHSLKELNNKNYFCSTFGKFNYFKKSIFQNKISNKLSNLNFISGIRCIPWNLKIVEIPVIEIVNYFRAETVFRGKIFTNTVKLYDVFDHNLDNLIKQINVNYLLVISLDHLHMFEKLYKVFTKKIKIKAVILTGQNLLNNAILKVFKKISSLEITFISVKISTLQTILKLQNFSLLYLDDDFKKVRVLQEYVCYYLKNQFISNLCNSNKKKFFNTPSSFKSQLRLLANCFKKRIILPESLESRILEAASICNKLGIAKCVLLGNPKDIHTVALNKGIYLEKDIEIINPDLIRNDYISHLMTKRAAKGMNKKEAIQSLQNNIVLATLMLDANKIDGLVSGSINTTANTIRPALQIIKAKLNYSLISSAFFMLLPEKVLIYADCAINISPTPEQLAEIAIQSSDTAISFGIEPKIAMISYSTGNSSIGLSVDKVRKATMIVRSKRPDLVIDGPIQYDAAVSKKVGKLKAPHSCLNGEATVCIFPDLNTGNSTYKAVQRSANITSIGPILQGLQKPVNDLSRGANVNDIVYTIALTAIQSCKIKK